MRAENEEMRVGNYTIQLKSLAHQYWLSYSRRKSSRHPSISWFFAISVSSTHSKNKFWPRMNTSRHVNNMWMVGNGWRAIRAMCGWGEGPSCV